MEDTAALLGVTTEALRAAREELQRVSNEVMATSDPLTKTLLDELREIRDSRMAAVREAKQILDVFREVRAFFLEKDYSESIDRMERVVQLCKEFQELKSSGVLDAVVETSLRLAAGPKRE